MKPSSSDRRFVRLLFSAPLLAIGACQTDQARPPAPPPAAASAPVAAAYEKSRAELSNEFTVTAEVVALTPSERVVTLCREDGSQFEVECGEGVRNFEQIKVGDELRVRYKEVLAATKLPPGESARPAQGAVAAGRAKEGAKPGAGAGVAVSVRVKIESIDRERGIVVFSLASGELIAHRVQTSQGRDFVKGLAVGDAVQLDYARTLALGIEKL